MSAPAPDQVDLSKYIELRDGVANLRGRRLSVAFLAAAERENHLAISDLAYQFTLTEEQVLAALLYYREHQQEIDAQDEAAAQDSAALHQRYGGMPGSK